MKTSQKFVYLLLNSVMVRNLVLRTVINRIVDNINICKALLGFSPGFAGQTRLSYRAGYFILNGYNKVKITNKGIFTGEILLENINYPVKDFIPAEGIDIHNENIAEIKKDIRNAVIRKDASISKKYFRLRGLSKLVMFGTLAAILVSVYRLLTDSYNGSGLREVLNILWLLPNIYFFTQTVLFYFSRLKHFSLKYNFEEAGAEEIYKLEQAEDQPYVIAVVPTYMEEPELLKRTLYSLCLQKYKNMKVVLLLGNDVYSRDSRQIENTGSSRRMVAKIRLEQRSRKNTIRRSYKHFKSVNLSDMDVIKKELASIKELYNMVAVWLYKLSWEFKTSETKYPTDSYLIKHSLIPQYVYYKRKSAGCGKIISGLCETSYSVSVAEEYSNKLEEFYKELNKIFSINIEVFMRTKYGNLEQQKTKAGNLTAYSSILGGTWSVKKNKSGKSELVASEKGKYVMPPKYFASFDCDTVVKPEYIIRKVSFLERKENASVGLIQSPYIVPAPEVSNVASASGTQSYWFLPVSVGISTVKSAFWLGYNGLIRFEAVRKIKTFLAETIIEDTENSLKIRKAGYTIFTSPEEQCITFSPVNIKSLRVQRIRWSCGGFNLLKILLGSMRNKTSGLNSLKEKLLCINYITGLNTLPLAVSIMYLLQSPLHNQYYFIETIPFLLYLLSYAVLMKSFTKYKLPHILDGLSVGIFMNFYHLAGTGKSIKDLFRIQKNPIFKSTPRGKNVSEHKLSFIEVLGVSLFAAWMGFRFINQLIYKAYYDIFPFLQLSLLVYGLIRFLGQDLGISAEEKKRAQNSIYMEIRS